MSASKKRFLPGLCIWKYGPQEKGAHQPKGKQEEVNEGFRQARQEVKEAPSRAIGPVDVNPGDACVGDWVALPALCAQGGEREQTGCPYCQH